MPDDAALLRPADRPTLLHTLAFALKHDRKSARAERDGLIARIVAEHLLEHLERSNYVVMQKPPVRAPSIPLPSNPTPLSTEQRHGPCHRRAGAA